VGDPGGLAVPVPVPVPELTHVRASTMGARFLWEVTKMAVHVLHRVDLGEPPRVCSPWFVAYCMGLSPEQRAKFTRCLARHLAHRGWKF
jgi:hypothetical protein